MKWSCDAEITLEGLSRLEVARKTRKTFKFDVYDKIVMAGREFVKNFFIGDELFKGFLSRVSQGLSVVASICAL